jgi:hypothetical protein
MQCRRIRVGLLIDAIVSVVVIRHHDVVASIGDREHVAAGVVTVFFGRAVWICHRIQIVTRIREVDGAAFIVGNGTYKVFSSSRLSTWS